MTLTDLLAAHGAASWDRQLCLAELIGNGNWNLDVQRGEITFGGRQTYPVQILGSESEGGGTWLWAWANAASGLPERVTAASRQLQEYGRQSQVPEFVAPELSLEAVNGHLLSTIASGICQADAYYRGPYDGGAVFLLLTAPETRRFADPTPTHFIRVFTEFIMNFACPHRPALLAYAQYKGYGCEEAADGSMVCTSPSGDALTATLDGEGRLVNFAATLTAAGFAAKPSAIPPEPEKKPWWKFGSR